MKTLVAAVALLALCAGVAGATVQRKATLHVLNLTPPTFRGSGFEPHERVTVSLRGLQARPVHVAADAHGRFRARLAQVPTCRAWTVRALGARGGLATYRHSRCASLQADVKGVVWRGPITNICAAGESCSAPASGVTVQALRSGTLVADTTTDDHGRFSFSLADGDYTFLAVGRGTEPETVRVRTSKPVRLAFLIDTGIR